MVEVLQQGGKEVFIHMDLVGGIGRDEAGVRYVARTLKPRGILTTRSSLVKCALDAGLVAVQRIFLVDSASLKSGIKQVSAAKPHLVEVMPGLVPRAISALSQGLSHPHHCRRHDRDAGGCRCGAEGGGQGHFHHQRNPLVHENLTFLFIRDLMIL